MTHGSGFDSDESFEASYTKLEAAEQQWDSHPSRELHKHTGAEIPLPQAEVSTTEVSERELLV